MAVDLGLRADDELGEVTVADENLGGMTPPASGLTADEELGVMIVFSGSIIDELLEVVMAVP